MGTSHKLITTSDVSDKEPSELMFCTPVDEALVHRSSVLQALKEAGQPHAISQLPEGIRQVNFFLWAGNSPNGRHDQNLTWPDLGSIITVTCPGFVPCVDASYHVLSRCMRPVYFGRQQQVLHFDMLAGCGLSCRLPAGQLAAACCRSDWKAGLDRRGRREQFMCTAHTSTALAPSCLVQAAAWPRGGWGT